jgi:hypothetical protein
MVYSTAELKSSGNKASPRSRPFWIGKLWDNNLPIWILLYISFKHILISLINLMHGNLPQSSFMLTASFLMTSCLDTQCGAQQSQRPLGRAELSSSIQEADSWSSGNWLDLHSTPVKFIEEHTSSSKHQWRAVSKVFLVTTWPANSGSRCRASATMSPTVTAGALLATCLLQEWPFWGRGNTCAGVSPHVRIYAHTLMPQTLWEHCTSLLTETQALLKHVNSWCTLSLFSSIWWMRNIWLVVVLLCENRHSLSK